MRIALCILLLVSTSLFAQEYSKIRRAEKQILKEKYAYASKNLEEVLLSDPENEYVHYRLGYSYFMLHDYEKAAAHYESAKSIMSDSLKYHFELYHIYSSLGFGSFAKESFIRYISLCTSCVKTDLLPGLSSNKLIYRKPVKEPIAMGYDGNRVDYYPYILDDKMIEHLEVKPKKNKPDRATQFKSYLTTHFSHKDYLFYNSEEFTRRNKLCGDKFGPFTLNDSLDKVYITRWNSRDQRLFIYFSSRANRMSEKWEAYKKLEIEHDDFKSNYIHPMLTKDGKHLIFASDRKGGLGGYDLWIGEIDGDVRLRQIKSLGTYVNTPGDEVYPSLGEEEVLFFASNGHYGFGNLDIYAGLKIKDKYRKTYNLGNRFNSSEDDYSLFYNKKKNVGFFTSNRLRTIDEKDIASDKIYSQSFDKSMTTIELVDENFHPIPEMKASVLSERSTAVSNENGKIELNMTPNGFKKLSISGAKYYSVDTVIAPFENRVLLKLEKHLPADKRSIQLASQPRKYPARNTVFVLTSQKDQRKYCGYTDANGMAEILLYADEVYEIDVPTYNYRKKDIRFDSLNNQLIQVFSDIEKQISGTEKQETKSSQSEDSRISKTMSDVYTIYYESGEYYGKEKTMEQIQYFISILNQNPSFRLEIESHTDCQGDEKHNLNLSRLRMEEAKNLFFVGGVSEKQLIGKYFGETRPINNCKCDPMDNYSCPSDEVKKNRRTEIKLIR